MNILTNLDSNRFSMFTCPSVFFHHFPISMVSNLAISIRIFDIFQTLKYFAEKLFFCFHFSTFGNLVTSKKSGSREAILNFETMATFMITAQK